MAAAHQFVAHRFWYSRFDPHIAAPHRELREPRRFERRLNIHLVIDEIRNELRLGMRLIDASHNPKADVCVATLHESGNDRVEWPLVRSQYIGMLGFEVKSTSTVVQNETHPLHRNARAPNIGDALYPGWDV